MNWVELLKTDFDQEAQKTRRLLEVVPETNLDWKPHPKSMSLARLAGHVAELPGWGASILRGDSFDIGAAAASGYSPLVATSRAQLLDAFTTSADSLRKAFGEVDDAALARPWRFLKGGVTLFELPKGIAFKDMVLNHVIHHRGQLNVYLRLRDVPLPSQYGPTADQPM